MKFNLTQFLPPSLNSKKENPDFLGLDIGLEKIAAGVFRPQPEETNLAPKLLGMGRKGFKLGDDFGLITTDVLKTTEAIVTTLPKKVLLGVSGVGTKTATVVARYQRSQSQKPITSEELQEILKRSAENQSPFTDEEKGKYKLFFSAVVWAIVDGAKIVNPLGSKGTELEVSCFHAYKKNEELEAWDKFLTDGGFEIAKIVPTSFALSKIIIRNGIQSLVLVRASENRTEVTFITEANIAEVATFDLGLKQIDLWGKAMEILFTDINLPNGIPDVIWIYPEGGAELADRARTSLLEINWSKDFKREVPNVRVGQKPEGFTLEDTPLLALSIEGVNSDAA